MKNIVLLSVGKQRLKEIRHLEDDYLKRFKSIYLKLIEIRSCDDDKEKEGDLISKEIIQLQNKSNFDVVLLEEKGNLYDSPRLSQWIFDDLPKNLIFVLGGSAGHGSKVYPLAKHRLSLSPLTLPHKLARLLLLEQLYRAFMIHSSHPYHK